jgi:hypothetical protein
MDGGGLQSGRTSSEGLELGDRALYLEFSSLLSIKLSPFGSATATIAQECFLVMLVVGSEPPLLRQVGR